MADRFPSLEDFDSGATTTQGDSTFDGGADDFLSREKALLGEDANQFTTSNDNAAFVEDGHDDLLGGGGGEEVHEFETSFPAIDTHNERVSPSPPVTSSYTNYQPLVIDKEDPEVIKQWRESRNLQLRSREERSEEKKQEKIKAARQNIDDFYENYNTKKEKMIAQTRREAEEYLASREDTAAGGTSWERIVKLVDLSGNGANGTGKEKFRELLMSLKKDQKAPGATGY